MSHLILSWPLLTVCKSMKRALRKSKWKERNGRQWKHGSFHLIKRNVNEIRRRFDGKESSPLEAIRELG